MKPFFNRAKNGNYTLVLDEQVAERLKREAAKYGLTLDDLLALAASKLVNGKLDVHDLPSKNKILDEELERLIHEHLGISSKLAALRFKRFSTHSGCSTESIRLLALEAENRSLCNELGLAYDDSNYKKAKLLFEKYHQEMNTQLEKGY
ncbi:MAG: hypothetical protein JRN68_00310 [Nitrososphaerota archaeon]|jgi:hypothetical protein|nr:hypothetical protein [Nitrososphaerota archaeon]